jgi:hypothetical protein
VALLKVDAEGADPLVLRGASKLLASGRVDAVLFEYGHQWTKTVDTGTHNLRSTTAFLDALGFDSFLLGRRGAVQLNGDCWDPLAEFWMWSNVFALRRRGGRGGGPTSAEVFLEMWAEG